MVVPGVRFISLVGDRAFVPAWVRDLDSFRRWVEHDDLYDAVRVDYIGGEVLVEMGKEQLFTHNAVKAELTAVLRVLTRAEKLGRYFADGAYVTNAAADLSAQPDGAFVASASWKAGQARLVRGKRDGGHVEVEGTPDLVIEIVSASSVQKDTEDLRDSYWRAGVAEYWLIDARRDPPALTVLRRTADGYRAVRPRGGWVKSGVLGHEFRLELTVDDDGLPDYTLHVR